MRNSSAKKVLAAVLVLAALAWGASNLLNQSEEADVSKLPSDVNEVAYVEPSAEKNERYAKEEKAAAEVAEAELDEDLQDAPSEGLSRLPEENPELAADILGGREVKIYKSQFIVSYNSVTLCPNYVCWALTADRTEGSAKRCDSFTGDPILQESARVETADYARSGYDRGHMCPAGDNKNSQQAMNESFYMTNICPQSGNLNRGDWNELENQCRTWAKDYGTLYIACGPIFDSKKPKKIGNRTGMKVSVPDRFFKVIFTMGRVPKAIGFIMPNASTNRDLREYAVSVDEVERITGFDFFYQIPEDIQDKAEAECKPAAWGI